MDRLIGVLWISALIVAVTPPVEAICTGPSTSTPACCSLRLFSSGYSYVVTRGCENASCGTEPMTSVTNELVGTFWMLGDGHPELTRGIDNGGFAALSTEVDPGWVYVYPGYNAFIRSSWCGSPAIDGLADFATNPNRCMAIVLEDRPPTATDAPGSMLSVMVKSPDSLGNWSFDKGSDYMLERVPPPEIASVRWPADTEVVVDLQGPTDLDLAASVHILDPECGTPGGDGPPVQGFRVYELRVPPGRLPSFHLPEDWTPRTGVLPLGSRPSITIDCSSSGLDAYLAIRLAFESGFEATYLSDASGRVRCAPPLPPRKLDPSRLIRPRPP